MQSLINARQVPGGFGVTGRSRQQVVNRSPARISSSCFRSRVQVVKAVAQQEEIDPATGFTAFPPYPQQSVSAGGLKWAYRQTAAKNVEAVQPPVVMLHGIGSSSYSYRVLMNLMSEKGFDCYAVDWIGHGGSDKPSAGNFAYTADAYVSGLDEFVKAVGIKTPFHMVVHGYILGQFGLLYAAAYPDNIQKLLILNMPLALNSPLRPELAPYKAPLPFMRPKPESKFAGDLFNASGSQYAMAYTDAQAYDKAYQEDPAASAAIYEIMSKLDFKQLISRVSEAFLGWRKDALLLFGGNDTFLDINNAMDFLSTKRTCMKLITVEAKIGHMPQEDFPEAFVDEMSDFFMGKDVSLKGTSRKTPPKEK
eukprot:TRINITY_DN2492_c0_g2_i2.p1 TRINITY_DN2492_c0_g2~~TRINITY_DN2492_c0_g2_i2.p1  ORF type:complete len:390 (+),score=79.83 TRINITY_DN2492_c0_g2_i2:77-1171(+)